jgi:CheY-like chemotaxis protein
MHRAKKTAAKEQDTKPIVLVVDDNQANLELLQAYLEDIDCQTIPARSGAEALAIARKQPLDLILLDVMMPQMSGFEVCKRIKADPATAHIPIIMVTALTELGDIERGVASGTDDFLSKPVNKWELIARVKTMLKLKHLSDRLEKTLAYLSEIEKQSGKAGAGRA